MSLSKWLNKEKELLYSKDYGSLILKALEKQICKDLNVDESDASFQSYSDALTLIELELSPLWKGQDENLKHMLYRIDLSEDVVRQNLQGKSIADQIQRLSELVAERELKKVISRLYFSGKLT